MVNLMKKSSAKAVTCDIALILMCLSQVIMPVGAHDFTLGIYGNANMDDIIDEDDIEYVEGIIEGINEPTALSDADYNGIVDENDLDQIEDIINGGEKELTIIDSANRTVTLEMPIDRAVWMNVYSADVPQMFGKEDKIVGVGDYIGEEKIRLPELSKLPTVGRSPPDYEKILSLNPDIFITYAASGYEHVDQLPGVPVVGIYFYKFDFMLEELMKLGYIFGEPDKAEHYISDYYERYIELIKERTETLSEDEKPTVMYTSTQKDKALCAGSGAHQTIEDCGGINIFADIPLNSAEIDPEEIIVRDPSIIIKQISSSDFGGASPYAVDNVSVMVEKCEEDITSRPEWSCLSAVKNEDIYAIHLDLSYGLSRPVAMIYLAKWFHPQLFEDLDPLAAHQELVDEYLGIDLDIYQQGVYVYNPEEHPDGR